MITLTGWRSALGSTPLGGAWSCRRRADVADIGSRGARVGDRFGPRLLGGGSRGYVLEGEVKFTFAGGREEVYEAGEAHHAPPGHTPTLYAGTEIVEFSPTGPLQRHD
jgi:hypothetical protein